MKDNRLARYFLALTAGAALLIAPAAMGQSIPDVIAEMTWNPAREIKQPSLGNLSVGSPADIAVFSVEHGRYGFVDMFDKKLMGKEKLICELTVRAGKVVYDLNGISAELWTSNLDNDSKLARRWTDMTERPHPAANQK